MKKILLLLLITSFSVLNGAAQDSRIWATYYGGLSNDWAFSVATDASGNVYLAGYTLSSSGISSGGFQNTIGGVTEDAFLAKFDSNGNRLWATYYGGTGIEFGYSVTTDAAGNVYLAGQSASTSGIASGGFQNTIGGNDDAFLVKFDSNGNRLWATYYGGTNPDYATSVATDAAGNVYLAGRTSSASGIASGGFDNTIGGSADAFLVKFDSNGNRLWATYYGGTGVDYGNSIATDAVGNVYLTGYTASASGIASGGFQNTIGGSPDAFLVKFDSNGNRLWATYYGGTNNEHGYSLATDSDENVYLAGQTTSASGIASGGFQNTEGGGKDAFLVKFNSTGNRLWATYYGGTENEEDGVVATDASGNVYLAGDAYSPSGIASIGFQNSLIGEEDLFVVKFSSSGIRLCATYYGQTHEEAGHVAVDGFGNVYLSGFTGSASGIASGGFQNTIGGDMDGFLVKLTTCSSNTLNVTAAPTSINCNNQCTGTATVTATNGTAPYSYSWNTNPVQTTQTATALCAGSYTVTVTDADNTTATSTVTITQPTALTASTSVTNACTGNNGSATVTASGGTAPYNYLWSPGGATTATVSNLAPATYTVTITDDNGCTQTATATIINSTGVTASIASQVNVLCNGGSTGSATVSATGGNGPYTYLWSPSNQTTVTATNLSAGTYSVTVTDANSCVSTQSVTITQPTAITASATATQTACGVSSGTATVNASGGAGGFTYVWTPGNQTTQTATGLGANTYSVTVTDANSCTQTASATVTNPNAPAYSSASQTNILCNGDNTGSATVVFTGGTAPYTYLWSPGNQTTQTATNLAAGAYTVTVTDNAACTNFHNIVITQPTAITLSIDSINASCGEQNGSISVDASGGTGAYTYIWMPSGATTDNITGLDAGTYSLLVTDANNCTKTATITLENSVAPTLSISAQTDVVCNGDNTGTATISTSGGTAPFSYAWSPSGQTTQTANNLAAGDYLVTVVDNNGCAAIDSVTITEPAALATVVTQEDATCGQADGSATVTVSGGTGTYSYSWSPTDQTDSTALALGEGTHTVTITDDNGCTRTETIVIANNGNSPDAGFGFDPSVVLLGGVVNFADSSIANGNALTNWYWNFGDGTTDTVQNPVHTFADTGSYPVMLVVTNSAGCSDTVIIYIDVTTEIVIPNVITPNGDAENEFFVIPNLSAYPESKLYIYNRWGKKIYEATNYQSDWNGEKHSAGTYFYVLLLPDGNEKHGTITVVK